MESIGIVLNTIAATMRTEELLKQSQALAGELQSQQEELQKTNDRLEQQAHTAASEELLSSQQEELRARTKSCGKANCCRQKSRSKPRTRKSSGPRSAGRKGRAAGAHLQVQVRVPGEHVARAAHAAQQPADPVEAARRQRGRQPHAQAGRVRADDPSRPAPTCWR